MGRNKYKASKIETDDGRFDSKLEFKRWVYLRQLEKFGVITNLMRQVPFTLIPSQYKYGKCIFRECRYVADFTYTIAETGEYIVEDTKGIVLDVFRIKQKLMYFVHGIVVQVVRKW